VGGSALVSWSSACTAVQQYSTALLGCTAAWHAAGCFSSAGQTGVRKAQAWCMSSKCSIAVACSIRHLNLLSESHSKCPMSSILSPALPCHTQVLTSLLRVSQLIRCAMILPIARLYASFSLKNRSSDLFMWYCRFLSSFGKSASAHLRFSAVKAACTLLSTTSTDTAKRLSCPGY